MIEDTLEKGYKSLLEAVAGLSSVTIEQHEDNSKEIAPPLVSVHCEPLVRIAPNADYYMSNCEFTCMTYIQDDKSRSSLKTIYNEVFNYISSLTPATLATETGLTIDGLVMDEQGEEERDESYQILSVKIKTYLTK